MDGVIKELRKFIVKEIINSDWSTEGRSNYYETKYVSIKKNFDTGLWQFNLNRSDDLKFYDFKTIGLNKIFLYILFLFIKRSVKKQANVRKNEVLVNKWNSFLKNNKDLDRDNKIKKIID
jgi:uncharacterized protein YprB with RNaseH-like and TPR domain